MRECVWGRIMTSWTLLEVNWTPENFSIFRDPKDPSYGISLEVVVYEVDGWECPQELAVCGNVLGPPYYGGVEYCKFLKIRPLDMLTGKIFPKKLGGGKIWGGEKKGPKVGQNRFFSFISRNGGQKSHF